MKFVFIFLLMGLFAASPAFLLDQILMPQLAELSQTYSGFDARAQQIANAK